MIKFFATQGIYTSKAKPNYKRGNNLHWRRLLIKVKNIPTVKIFALGS